MRVTPLLPLPRPIISLFLCVLTRDTTRRHVTSRRHSGGDNLDPPRKVPDEGVQRRGEVAGPEGGRSMSRHPGAASSTSSTLTAPKKPSPRETLDSLPGIEDNIRFQETLEDRAKSRLNVGGVYLGTDVKSRTVREMDKFTLKGNCLHRRKNNMLKMATRSLILQQDKARESGGGGEVKNDLLSWLDWGLGDGNAGGHGSDNERGAGRNHPVGGIWEKQRGKEQSHGGANTRENGRNGGVCGRGGVSVDSDIHRGTRSLTVSQSPPRRRSRGLMSGPPDACPASVDDYLSFNADPRSSGARGSGARCGGDPDGLFSTRGKEPGGPRSPATSSVSEGKSQHPPTGRSGDGLRRPQEESQHPALATGISRDSSETRTAGDGNIQRKLCAYGSKLANHLPGKQPHLPPGGSKRRAGERIVAGENQHTPRAARGELQPPAESMSSRKRRKRCTDYERAKAERNSVGNGKQRIKIKSKHHDKEHLASTAVSCGSPRKDRPSEIRGSVSRSVSWSGSQSEGTASSLRVASSPVVASRPHVASSPRSGSIPGGPRSEFRLLASSGSSQESGKRNPEVKRADAETNRFEKEECRQKIKPKHREGELPNSSSVQPKTPRNNKRSEKRRTVIRSAIRGGIQSKEQPNQTHDESHDKRKVGKCEDLDRSKQAKIDGGSLEDGCDGVERILAGNGDHTEACGDGASSGISTFAGSTARRQAERKREKSKVSRLSTDSTTAVANNSSLNRNHVHKGTRGAGSGSGSGQRRLSSVQQSPSVPAGKKASRITGRIRSEFRVSSSTLVPTPRTPGFITSR